MSRLPVHGIAVAIVLVNIANNISILLSNLPQLTIWHHVISGTLWLLLPTVGVVLLWRGRPSGRWLLSGLFGFRALIASLFVASMVVQHGVPITFKYKPALHNLVEVVLYGLAACWLGFSKSVSNITHRRSDQCPATTNGSNGP